MFKKLSHDARTILLSVVAASLVVGPGAAAAAYVANADKVDNRHAVSSGASKAARAGKLVATNGSGLLPNNIIAKAAQAGLADNANLLDGKDSSAFLDAGGKAADSDKIDGLDATELQRRVSGACAAGTALTAVEVTGQVTCEGFLAPSGKAADADKLDGLDSTALTGLSNYELVAGSIVAAAPNNHGSAQAYCPSGMQPMGGGHQWVNTGNAKDVVVLSSFPTASGWQVNFLNYGSFGSTIALRAYATCTTP